MAFCKDLQLVQDRIDNVMKAPMARQEKFWDNYALMFPDRGERLPELDLVDQYISNFRGLITAFLNHNKRHYERKKTPRTDQGNQV